MTARFQHRVVDFVCHPARVAEDTAVVLLELEPDGWEVAAVHVGDDVSHGVDVRRVTLVLKRPTAPTWAQCTCEPTRVDGFPDVHAVHCALRTAGEPMCAVCGLAEGWHYKELDGSALKMLAHLFQPAR